MGHGQALSKPDPSGSPWLRWALGFLAAPMLALAAVHALSLDLHVAERLFDPASAMADFVREYSPSVTWLLGIGLVLANVAVALVPRWRSRGPTLRAVSVQWLLLVLLSLVVLSEGLGKQYFDRPRPRETVELGGTIAYQPLFTAGQAFNGQSQVSSHAVAALLCAAVFFFAFPYRRRLARVVLVAGLLFSAWVGYGRMVSGAHFLSDLLVSFLLTMAAALAIAWVSAACGRRVRAAAVIVLLGLVGWAWAVFGMEQVGSWRTLDRAMVAASASAEPSLRELQRRHARLLQQGWLLRSEGIDGVGPAHAGPQQDGVAGLRAALSALPPGASFRLALADTTPFEPERFGMIRIACGLAVLTAADPLAGTGQGYRVYQGTAGSSGACPGSPFAYLDFPRAHQRIDQELVVSGWAVDAGSDITTIEVLVSGRVLGLANVRVRQIEAGASFTQLAVPLAEMAMFEARWPRQGLPEGWHPVVLRTTNTSGSTTLTPPTLVKIGE